MAQNSETQKKNEESSVQLLKMEQFNKMASGTDNKEIPILIAYSKDIIVILREIELWRKQK